MSDSFGTADVGSATQPCPLGHLHVVVERADGEGLDLEVAAIITGPSDFRATVSRSTGRWSSPKTFPGDYQVAIDYQGAFARRYQPIAAMAVTLPESSAVTARFGVVPFAVLPVRIVREDTGAEVAGATVVIRHQQGHAELTTDAAGLVTFERLATGDSPTKLSVEPLDTGPGYLPGSPLEVSLAPGTNPTATLKVHPLAALRVTVRNHDTGALLQPERLTLTTAAGEAADYPVDPQSGIGTADRLLAGSYQLSVSLGPEDQARFEAPPAASVSLVLGEIRDLEIRVTARPRRLVVVSESRTTGIWAGLTSMGFAKAKAALQHAWDSGADIMLPLPGVRPFDDFPITARGGGGSPPTASTRASPSATPGMAPGVYADDAKQAIAVVASGTVGGKPVAVIWTSFWGPTHDPRQWTLGIKWRDWGLGHWLEHHTPLGKHLHFEEGFFIVSGADFDIKTEDLPDEVASFYGWDRSQEANAAAAGATVVGSHPADSDEVTIAVPSGTPELKRGDGIGIGADRYVVLADAILDADGVEVRIAPPLIAALADGEAVSHFPAKPAEIAVKPGLNLYTKLAVDGLPKLESWLNGLDVKERYLKLTGYLSAEVSLVLSAESQEKNQPIEIVGDMALIATIPLPVLSPLLRRVVTGRELSLEIGFKVEYQPTFKPKPATTSNTTAASPPAPPAAPSPPQKGGAEDQAPVSPGMSDKEQPEIVEGPGEKPTETPAEKKDDGDAPEGKFRVQLKDEWTIPLPVFDLSAPAPKTEDVTFSQAYQVEIGGGETEWSAEYGSDYKWDLLAFAVHDLAFSFSATKKKPDGATPGAAKETEKKGKLAAEFDIGRAEKIGELELEFEAPDDAAKKRKAWAKWEATLKLKPDAALALGPAIRDVILPIWSAVLKP